MIKDSSLKFLVHRRFQKESAIVIIKLLLLTSPIGKYVFSVRVICCCWIQQNYSLAKSNWTPNTTTLRRCHCKDGAEADKSTGTKILAWAYRICSSFRNAMLQFWVPWFHAQHYLDSHSEGLCLQRMRKSESRLRLPEAFWWRLCKKAE